MEALRSSFSSTIPASRITSKYFSAEGTRIGGESYGRNPRVVLPEITPAYSNGITAFPSNATNHRIGRENATPDSFHLMDFSNFKLSTNVGNASANTSGV